MTTVTNRHELPMLAPGQAQKEMFHNEALAALDMLMHPAVEAVGSDAPPIAPALGRSWILSSAPTGEWAGHAHALASWTDGGWRFAAAIPAMRVIVRASGLEAVWDGTAWRTGEVRATIVSVDGLRVVGSRQAAIPAPTGGATIDAEARTTLNGVLSALRAHGLIG